MADALFHLIARPFGEHEEDEEVFARVGSLLLAELIQYARAFVEAYSKKD